MVNIVISNSIGARATLRKITNIKLYKIYEVYRKALIQTHATKRTIDKFNFPSFPSFFLSIYRINYIFHRDFTWTLIITNYILINSFVFRAMIYYN